MSPSGQYQPAGKKARPERESTAKSRPKRAQLKPVGAPASSPPEAEADRAGAAIAAGEGVGPLSGMPAAVPGRRLLVDDDAVQPGPGQARKADFLIELRAAVTAAAEEQLTGTGRTTDDCPELDYWFGYYELRDADQVERAIHRYAPMTAEAQSAPELYAPLVERVRAGVQTWAATGQVSGLPEGLSFAGRGLARLSEGAADTLSAGERLLFKRVDSAGADKEGDPGQLASGRPLEAPVRAGMERSFGHSFRDVRIHDSPEAASIARSLGARAFAVGDDVAFAAGQYRPDTLYGRVLLAHELAHTIQQRGGGPPGPGQEREAKVAAATALTGAHPSVTSRSGLALQRCGDGPAPAKDAGTTAVGDAGAKPSPSPTPTPPAKSAERVELEKVKSLQIGDAETAAASKWDFLKTKKWAQREEFLTPAVARAARAKAKAEADEAKAKADAEAKAKADAEAKAKPAPKGKAPPKAPKAKPAPKPTPRPKIIEDVETLQRMKDRWAGLRKALVDPTFRPDSSPPAWLATVTADAEAETKDLRSLKVKDKLLSDSVVEFLAALKDFVNARTTLVAERPQWTRLDEVFLSADVKKLLDANKTSLFTPADVKALVGQESGDLTDVDIVGVDPKKPGVRYHGGPNPGYVGIAQLATEGRDEAIAWAKKAGVTIPAKPDPRTVPAESIKLAAAYLGQISEKLPDRLPEKKPTGVELKKFILAGYNVGWPRVVTRVTEAKLKTYTWDNVKHQFDKDPGQPLEYLERIMKRHAL